MGSHYFVILDLHTQTCAFLWGAFSAEIDHFELASIGCRPRHAAKLDAIDALGLLIKARDDWAYITTLY